MAMESAQVKVVWVTSISRDFLIVNSLFPTISRRAVFKRYQKWQNATLAL